MYLFLGQETVLPLREIIGIFDLDTTTVSKNSRDFLKAAQENGQVVAVSVELPASFVLSGNRGKTKVYLSQISTATLLKRTRQYSGKSG